METNKAEGKRSMEYMMNEEGVMEDEEEDEDEDAEYDNNNKRKRALTLSSKRGSTRVCCQVEDCSAVMAGAKPYHRRHKVCERHAKATVVVRAGIRQRFCQQCSRFHELSEFDEAKRSCRRRLAGHNERRRKSSYDFHGDGSS